VAGKVGKVGPFELKICKPRTGLLELPEANGARAAVEPRRTTTTTTPTTDLYVLFREQQSAIGTPSIILDGFGYTTAS